MTREPIFQMAAIGTLTGASQRILNEYLRISPLADAEHDSTPLFRNRSGNPYSKDTLGDDFRDIRLIAFGPEETRTLGNDLRRAGTREALTGGASKEDIGSETRQWF